MRNTLWSLWAGHRLPALFRNAEFCPLFVLYDFITDRPVFKMETCRFPWFINYYWYEIKSSKGDHSPTKCALYDLAEDRNRAVMQWKRTKSSSFFSFSSGMNCCLGNNWFRWNLAFEEDGYSLKGIHHVGTWEITVLYTHSLIIVFFQGVEKYSVLDLT
jgi:hypothetical protein